MELTREVGVYGRKGRFLWTRRRKYAKVLITSYRVWGKEKALTCLEIMLKGDEWNARQIL